MAYTRNVKFTAQADEEILLVPQVKALIMDMVHAKTDFEYDMMKRQGFDMNVDIYTTGTRIKINNEAYNDLIEDVIYSTGNLVKIYSIKSENAISGTISFTMRGDA